MHERATGFEGSLDLAVRDLKARSSKFDWVGVYLLKDDVLELGPYVGTEPSHKVIPVGKGVCGLAVSSGKNQNISDVKVSEHYLACDPAVRSELVVLIRNPKGSIVGQIDIDSQTPDAFGEEEESMVKKVAEELGEKWNE